MLSRRPWMGSGSGPSASKAVPVVVHRRGGVGVRPGDGHLGQHRVHAAQVDVLPGGAGEVLGLGDPGEQPGLLAGHRPGGERRGQRGQLRQRAAGAHHPRGLGRRQVGVPAQPRGHGLEPVDLRGTGHLGLPHGAGDLGGQPVLRGQQRTQPVQQRRTEQRGQVLAGQGVQGGQQLLHDTSHRFDQTFEL
jgi:hypothetical protein